MIAFLERESLGLQTIAVDMQHVAWVYAPVDHLSCEKCFTVQGVCLEHDVVCVGSTCGVIYVDNTIENRTKLRDKFAGFFVKGPRMYTPERKRT